MFILYILSKFLLRNLRVRRETLRFLQPIKLRAAGNGIGDCELRTELLF